MDGFQEEWEKCLERERWAKPTSVLRFTIRGTKSALNECTFKRDGRRGDDHSTMQRGMANGKVVEPSGDDGKHIFCRNVGSHQDTTKQDSPVVSSDGASEMCERYVTLNRLDVAYYSYVRRDEESTRLLTRKGRGQRERILAILRDGSLSLLPRWRQDPWIL